MSAGLTRWLRHEFESAVTRWTEEDLRALLAKPPLSAHAVNGTSHRAKYHNEKCTWNGLKFDSHKELEDYRNFKFQETAGAIRSVIRQVSFPLSGTTRRIRVDFMVVELDGRIRWFDSKGFVTPEWSSKRDQVRQAYGIEIEIIGTGGR
jgi:hypothetical protein